MYLGCHALRKYLARLLLDVERQSPELSTGAARWKQNWKQQ